MNYISRPRIVPDSVESRKYQVDMASTCLEKNTLVILPTGLGKTVIALLVAVEILEKGKKVLILAPTKPLVEQHYDFFSSKTVGTRIGTMNGNMDPKKRASVIAENDVIVCTPQVVSNDLDGQRYDLNDFGLVIYDEAHRATGNYAYVNVSRYYHKGLSLGMTASPGHDKNKIMEVCENLGIEKVDIHTDEDEDVSPYIHDVFISRIEVNMPDDLVNVIKLLNRICRRFKESGSYQSQLACLDKADDLHRKGSADETEQGREDASGIQRANLSVGIHQDHACHRACGDPGDECSQGVHHQD